jgi:ABC-type multidrug transport system permease subunit
MTETNRDKLKREISLDAVLVSMALLLFLANLIWSKRELNVWYSLWTVCSSIVLAVMVLLVLLSILTATSAKAALKTIFIVIVANALLLWSNDFLLMTLGKLSLYIVVSLLSFLFLLFSFSKYLKRHLKGKK